MAAPIHYEPTDPPTLPVVPVTPEAFDAIARDRGAVIELDPNGRVAAVLLNSVEYVTAVGS